MPIQDLAGNILTGTVGQMLGWVEPPEPEEILPLKMYNFILESIRIEDALRGNLFLKRMLEGPQLVWNQTQVDTFRVKDLWDLTKIPDEFLQYLKNIVGWTIELENITDELTADQLRKLIGASIPLWKTRGPDDSITAVLALVTGARLRLWNWFDFRWVLDETALGEEHEGRDPWIIELPGSPLGGQDEYRSNLRIVDDGTLNRSLVINLVKLMRTVSERIEVSYINFLDQFRTKGDNIQWGNLSTGSYAVYQQPDVDNGRATMVVGASERFAFVTVNESTLWSTYAAYWRGRVIDVTGVSPRLMLPFYVTGKDNYYFVELLMLGAPGLVRLRKVVGGVVFGITIAAMTLDPTVWYGVRVTIEPEGGTNRIKVYVDADEVINTTDPSHTAGTLAFGGLDATVELDEIEMFQLPLDTELVDINS